MANSVITFKPKYNLTIGFITFSLIFLISHLVGKTGWRGVFEEGKGATIIYSLLWLVAIIIPSIIAFIKARTYEIDNDILIIRYPLGIYSQKLDLKRIRHVYAKDVAIKYSQDIRFMMGINSDKCVKLVFDNQKKVKIDGNTINDEDYKRLKWSLLKYTKN